MPITQFPVDQEEIAISVDADRNALVEVADRRDPADLDDVLEEYVRVAEEVTTDISSGVVDEPAGYQESTPVPTHLDAIAQGLAEGRTADLRTNATDDAASEKGADTLALIREGAALLGPRACEVVDLSVRQGLTDTEIGAIVGIRREIASETIALTKVRVGQALSILILVRTRINLCPELRRVVGTQARADLGSGPVDVVDAHLDQCADCAYAWSQIPPHLDLLRQLPVQPPRLGQRERISERVSRRGLWGALGARIQAIHAAVAVVILILALGVPGVSGSGAGAAGSDASDSPSVENLVQTESPAPTAPVGPTRTTTPYPGTTVAEATPTPTSPPSTTVAPSEPPTVTIITPINGQRFDTSSRFTYIDLVAVVQDDVDDGLEVDWRLGPTYLGSGNAITVTSTIDCPDTVTYTISATVRDSSANTTRETVTFSVVCGVSDG